MPDDHSDVVPLLPIPNRTVKRVSADDSADSRVKVGHRQAITASESPTRQSWAFCFVDHTLSNFKPSIRATFLFTSSEIKLSTHPFAVDDGKKAW
jgi:hypothetical protein